MTENVVMPGGQPFVFWEDATLYQKIYHVSQSHPDASDQNPGTQDSPFKTINRAAQLLMPGEKVVVHQGIYRECVRPAREGSGADQMICYSTAPGEDVVVRGSEQITTPFVPSRHFSNRKVGLAKIWMVDLPVNWFIGYNPFICNNMSLEFTTFNGNWLPEEIRMQQLRRGRVYCDGRKLQQVLAYHEMAKNPGSFWVEEPGLRLHVRLWDDADPNGHAWEATTREQAFVPLTRHLGYIRLSGFKFEYGADGVPVPQRALVSAWRGHHWIIEDCAVRGANAVGIDVGNETWHADHLESEQPVGGHILRRNQVSDCGICGIAGVAAVNGTLVEDNLVEHIGGPHIERIWETAGLKFHECDHVLIRRNIFRHIQSAPGVWLDYLNCNSRVTENIFYDIETLNGAVFIEVSHAVNAVDHNVLWRIKRPSSGDRFGYGMWGAVRADTGEKCTIANNLFGEIEGCFAISADLGQAKRIVGGRVGLCRDHRIMNNVICGDSKRIQLGRWESQRIDGNLYDERHDTECFVINYPSPEAILDFSAWREHYGYDWKATQAVIDASFDLQTLTVSIEVKGQIPECPPVPQIGVATGGSPGPFHLLPGKQVYQLLPGSTWI